MNASDQHRLLPSLPQHSETERAILGAALVDPDNLKIAGEIVTPGEFFVAANRKIFASMLSMANEVTSVDLVILCELLRQDADVVAVGGTAYISALCDRVHKKAPVALWAKMVHDAATLRSIAYAGQSITNAALESYAQVDEVADVVRKIADSTDAARSLRVHGILASEVTPRSINWLWIGRIPLGKSRCWTETLGWENQR